ncbi:DUF3226 domain-containing protein [Brachyspira murdochii]|uniref:DUF3226 domain-containing protein n=1 Tax=Brachyspira murdochii TaxID=84378 RepID=UPI0030044D20
MKQKYLILVEGKADKKFLEDYIKYHYNYINNNIKIEINGGKDFNENKVINIKKYIDDNYRLIVIFDADNDIKSSMNNIKINLKNYIADDDIFLFPNNKDNGNLENMLINIACKKRNNELF